MNKEPRILVNSFEGRNNENLEDAVKRVDKSGMYEDQSTIIICPTRGMFPTRVVQSWMKLMHPTNQQVAGPIFAESMKVDIAYETLIEYILSNPILNKYKYVLTIEEDNLPPSDGLIKLLENMKEYDVVSGLYWAKGETGFPMIFGNPEKEEDYLPQTPKPGEVQECNGLPMGFTLFKLDLFRKLKQPWFKTVQKKEEGRDIQHTQDLHFFIEAKKQDKNLKFAVDNRVLVGHYHSESDTVF